MSIIKSNTLFLEKEENLFASKAISDKSFSLNKIYSKAWMEAIKSN